MDNEIGLAGLDESLLDGNIEKFARCSDGQIFQKAKELQNSGRLNEKLLSALDEFWMIRLLDLAASPHGTEKHASDLAGWLGRLGNKTQAKELNAFSLPYQQRWEAYSDLFCYLAQSKRIEKVKKRTDNPKWQEIAVLIQAYGEQGCLYTELLAKFSTSRNSPMSKSAFTQLVAPMRECRWIEGVREGREVRFFLGPVALESLVPKLPKHSESLPKEPKIYYLKDRWRHVKIDPSEYEPANEQVSLRRQAF